MTRPLPLTVAILCAGAALQALLWSRQWIYGDQYALLLSGIEVIETGHLPPFAKTMSGGGRIPGALLPLLVAVPLEWWADYRAPGLLIGLSHLMGAAVLSICLGRALGARFLAAYLAVYWLSPWRLYHAGFVWEPTYVFLPAALHLASAYRLRERPHRGWSLLHAATLALALQLHGSFLVLVLLTAGLAAARRIRLDLRGSLLGVLAGGLTLLPTAQALAAGSLPRILPGNTDELPWVLVGLVNLPKSLAYWWRLGSAFIGRRLEQTVYAERKRRHRRGPAFASGLTGCGHRRELRRRWRSRWFVLALLSAASVLRHPTTPTARRSSADWLALRYAGWCLAALCARPWPRSLRFRSRMARRDSPSTPRALRWLAGMARRVQGHVPPAAGAWPPRRSSSWRWSFVLLLAFGHPM